MKYLFLFLVFVLPFEAPANPISRRYRKVPIQEAHRIYGQSSFPFFNPLSIKVFVWNIKKSELSPWRSEFLSLGHEKDLILVQEAYSDDLMTNTISEFFGHRWDMGISFIYKKGNIPTGTMIGSTVSPTEFLVKHSSDLEPVALTPKSISFGKYPLANGETLLVINIHGINLTEFETFQRHMDQAEREIEKHDGPVLFAGDFNTRTQMRTKYMLNVMKKHGLKNVIFKNGDQRTRWKLTKNYLDHSFVRGLTVTNAEVIGTTQGSDHKPMLMELSL
jgi:endonuclease/exonuclease/phosphatase (EEP) superfamily protein YafD